MKCKTTLTILTPLMINEYSIQHGISMGFDGSSYSTTLDGNKYVVSTVQGPTALSYSTNDSKLDIRLRLILPNETTNINESQTSYYIFVLQKLLLQIIEFEEVDKTISIQIMSNTSDVCMIINTLMVSILDSGISMSSVFYAKMENEEICVYDLQDTLIYQFVMPFNIYETFDHKKIVNNVVESFFMFN